MISNFRRGVERRFILRGIYEENLRIVGKVDEALPPWRPPLPLRANLVFFYLVFLLFFAGPDYLNSTLHIEKQIVKASPEVEQNAGLGTIPKEYLAFVEERNLPLKKIFGLGVRTIVIDAGHGGADPGTMGKLGLKEKDIVLDVAHRLKEKLEIHEGYRVLLTRSSDEFIPLQKRARMANELEADLFVSIHVNYLPSRPINIIETFYFGSSDDEQSLSLATRENSDSNYSIGDFRKVAEKLGDTLKLQESRQLALDIQEQLFENVHRTNSEVVDRGIKTAPFVVLMGIDMPGVLAEISCLSNRQEELKLWTERYREDLAGYLEQGIIQYMKKES